MVRYGVAEFSKDAHRKEPTMSADDHHPPAAPPPEPVTDPKWLGPAVGLAFALIVLFGLGVASVAAYNSEGGDADHSEEGEHSEDSDAGHSEEGDGHDDDSDADHSEEEEGHDEDGDESHSDE